MKKWFGDSSKPKGDPFAIAKIEANNVDPVRIIISNSSLTYLTNSSI
jgi:hypothetical protein